MSRGVRGFFCFAQDVSQPQPAKVVILSERGQEKSAKDASLSRIVLEKSATPVNSSEGLRLGMMLSQQAAGCWVLGLRKARASKSPGRVSSACTFFSTHQWPNGPQGWVWASPWPLGAPLASPWVGLRVASPLAPGAGLLWDSQQAAGTHLAPMARVFN